MIRIPSSKLLLLLVTFALLATHTSAFFPGNTTDTIVREPIYSVDTYMIPWQLWTFLAAVGLIFLALSVCYPERGELVTGTLALLFNTVVWLTSSFIGFWEVKSAILPVGEVQTLVTQPVVMVMEPLQIPYLFLAIFLISVINWLLGVFNFLTKPAKIPQSRLE